MATASIDLLNNPFYRLAIDLHGAPQLAVLDTSGVRTGLQGQLEYGAPPRSIREVRDGTMRLYMEHDTLVETARRLDRFAKQLGEPKAQLVEMLNKDWLPFITVVKLPEHLRRLDKRACEVEALDADDFPAASLAALLSPCIVLTHNVKHFAPLGVREWAQGTDAVAAAAEVRLGELHIGGILIVPAAPVVTVGAGVKLVADRVGPAGWLLLPLLGLAGYYYYRRQPPERRERVRETAKNLGHFLMEETSKAAEELALAQEGLKSRVVPGPEQRTPVAAVLRLLARSSESLSAQQICDVLDDDVRPAVTDLREYLHANKDDGGPFVEVRRGGFELGRNGYRIRASAA